MYDNSNINRVLRSEALRSIGTVAINIKGIRGVVRYSLFQP